MRCILSLFVAAVFVLTVATAVTALCGDDTVDPGEVCDPPSTSCSFDCHYVGACSDQCVSAATADGTALATLRLVPCELRLVSVFAGDSSALDWTQQMTCDADGSGTLLRVEFTLDDGVYHYEVVFAEPPTTACDTLRREGLTTTSLHALMHLLTAPTGFSYPDVKLSAVACPRTRCYTLPFQVSTLTASAQLPLCGVSSSCAAKTSLVFDTDASNPIWMEVQIGPSSTNFRADYLHEEPRRAATACVQVGGLQTERTIRSSFGFTSSVDFNHRVSLPSPGGIATDPRATCELINTPLSFSGGVNEYVLTLFDTRTGARLQGTLSNARPLIRYERVCNAAEQSLIDDGSSVLPPPTVEDVAPTASLEPSISPSAAPHVFSLTTDCYASDPQQFVLQSATDGALLAVSWRLSAVWPSTVLAVSLFSVAAIDTSVPALSCAEAFGNVLLQFSDNSGANAWALSWEYSDTSCAELLAALDEGGSGTPVGATMRTQSIVVSNAGRVYVWQADATTATAPQTLAYYQTSCTPLISASPSPSSMPSASPAPQQPRQPIQPLVSCRRSHPVNGMCSMSFGYNNPNAFYVVIPALSVNNTVRSSARGSALSAVEAAIASAGVPSTFQPGVHNFVFTVLYPCMSELVWSVTTPVPAEDRAGATSHECLRECATSLIDLVTHCLVATVVDSGLTRCASSAFGAGDSPQCTAS